MAGCANAGILVLSFLVKGAGGNIVFGGHSTVLITMGKAVILTDPNLSERVWTLKRKSRPGLSQRHLDRVNLVLVSHGHYDHLDLRTVKRINRDATVIVPPGLAGYFTRYGFKDVRTMTWWEQAAVHGVRVVVVPARHFKGRNPVAGGLYQGYVIDGPYQVYFAGDTGWFEGLKEMGEMFKLDAALLPIGAYNPWSVFGHHMTPEQAIKALMVLGAGLMVPIHWGAFRLSLEPIDEPIERLKLAAKVAGVEGRVAVLNPGDAVALPRRNDTLPEA